MKKIFVVRGVGGLLLELRPDYLTVTTVFVWKIVVYVL